MADTRRKGGERAKPPALIPADSSKNTARQSKPRIDPPSLTALGSLRDVDVSELDEAPASRAGASGAQLRDIHADLDEAPAVRAGRKLVAAIGIDRYWAWPRLSNAASDAVGAMRLFQRLGFEPVAPPLLDEAATYDAIRRLVTDDLAGLGDDDSLVLFVAGHGHTSTRVFEKAVVKTGYIIPVDGNAPGRGAARWLRLDSLLSDVARLPPRHILVILDACHSGIALDSLLKWRGAAAEEPGSLEALRRRQSRRVITSALDDQRAMDSGPVPGHSLFTGCLVEALTGGLAKDGKRAATGSELWQYVRERVTTYPGSQQTPDYGALELDDRGELVMPLVDGAPVRARAARGTLSPASQGKAAAGEPPRKPVRPRR